MSNIIYKGYRVPIYPTDEQKMLINRYINMYRYVYNWAIDTIEDNYKLFKEGKAKRSFLSYYDLTILFTKFKDQKDKEWLNKLPIGIARNAMKDVIESYKSFFNLISNHPKYKSKKKSPKMFKLRADRFYIQDNMFKLDGCKDMIYSKYYTGLSDISSQNRQHKYTSVSISIDKFGNYFISFNVETYKAITSIIPNIDEPIGIDLGIRKTLTLSTGESFNQPDTRHIRNHIKRIDRQLQKDYKRRRKMERTNPDIEVKLSNRAEKRSVHLRKLYKKEANIRKNFYHNITKQIVSRRPRAIVMEDLEVENMKKNHNIAKNLAHVSFYEIIKMFKYKCDNALVPFIQAPKYYKSTQICSNCGAEQKIGRKRTYKCFHCGMILDRDINAAINLAHLAY